MKFALETYLRTNAPYWLRLGTNSAHKPQIISLSHLDELRSGEQYNRQQLEANGFLMLAEGIYHIYIDDQLIVLYRRGEGVIPRVVKLLFDETSNLRAWGEAAADQFRSRTKSQLIQALCVGQEGNSTENILAAFRDYTFFDGFSGWLYNHLTGTLTRIAADFPSERDYKETQQGPLLTSILTSTNGLLSSAIIDGLPDGNTSGFKWLIAFTVSSSGQQTALENLQAVIFMYSKHERYELREETLALLRSFLQQNLADRYFDRFLKLNEVRAVSRMQFNLDDPNSTMQRVAEEICSALGWESCAIMLRVRGDSPFLERCALACPGGTEPRPKFDPSGRYPIGAKSMTTEVFNTGKVVWSYDISNDRRNTHTLDDPTRTSPCCWLGIPIATHNGEVIGVLRVKNKIPSSRSPDKYFASVDVHTLHTIASDLGSMLQHCEVYQERRRLAEQREKEVSQLEDFLKTFRHEIRSPLQAVCFAPERLIQILTTEAIVLRDAIPKRLSEYLADFKATSNRLDLISKALTLQPEELVKDIVRHNIYKDCIAPVLAFATSYAEKRGRRIWVDKNSLLVNLDFDAMAMTIAFHALLDNAIKYSDEGSLIRVIGEHVQGGRQIVVENRTAFFAIDLAEVPHVREKYYRGLAPRRQKLEGSGIGLFLADRIMELHGGELALLRPNSPVSFALRLKN